MPAEEKGIDRVIVADARHSVEFALIRYRIDRLGRSKCRDDLNLIPEDQLLCDFGSAVRIRLAVLDDELNGMDGPVD